MLLLDLCEVTTSHTAFLAQAVLEAVQQSSKLPSGWKASSRYLSKTERESLRRRTVQEFMDIFRSLPNEKEFEAAAHADRAKKGWYMASANTLLKVFGPDTPRFASLLAAMPSQLSATENLRLSVRLWERWIDAGRPKSPKQIDALAENTPGIGKQTSGTPWKANVHTALASGEPEKVMRSSRGEDSKGEKGRSNLLGDLSHVANDAWMTHFGKTSQSVLADRKDYFAMTAKIRKVAEKMGWEPAEVQETVWSFFKALAESRTKGRKSLEKPANDHGSASEDFADAMTQDGEVQDAIQRLRNRGLAGEPSQDLRDGGQDPSGSPLSAAAERGLAGSLARVTDRAERLKDAEDHQYFITTGYHFPNATDVKWDRKRVTFTITDPREIAEWREKPRKADDHYGAVVGMKGDKWQVIHGVSHGSPTVSDEDSKITISLPFNERDLRKPMTTDPERWRTVERKKQERADRVQAEMQPAVASA